LIGGALHGAARGLAWLARAENDLAQDLRPVS
jgi:hypothetical protein